MLASAVRTRSPLWTISTKHSLALPSAQRVFASKRFASTDAAARPKTALVLLNMGGPTHPADTKSFLTRLFADSDIIELGGGWRQSLFGKIFVTLREDRVRKQYELIGGSPIRKWTEHQGAALAKRMDQLHPESAPHKAYVAFRYADPLTDDCLAQMKADGVERAVAFSQFPQWSCTTTGSSLNELWRELKRLGMEKTFKWSIIDRYPTHPLYVDALCARIEEKLASFASGRGTPPVLLFSAHSVPMKVVQKGDTYVTEVAATVRAVMDRLVERDRMATSSVPKYVMAWQSKVGFLPWMAPHTSDAIEALAKAGHKKLLVVPVAFTSDHIETLFEIGHEYKELAEEKGIEKFEYTEGLNGSEIFVEALAQIASKHLSAGELYSPQYKMRCLGCEKPLCRGIVNAASD